MSEKILVTEYYKSCQVCGNSVSMHISTEIDRLMKLQEIAREEFNGCKICKRYKRKYGKVPPKETIKVKSGMTDWTAFFAFGIIFGSIIWMVYGVYMKKHFVIFMSPGTFVSERTEKPIDSWNVDLAVSMAKDIKERHGAKPYGFYFTTRGRSDDELDSKVVKTSGMYYLGGTVETIKEVFDRNDPKERILRSNMENNGIKKVITNNNSWRITLPLKEEDVVLDVIL